MDLTAALAALTGGWTRVRRDRAVTLLAVGTAFVGALALQLALRRAGLLLRPRALLAGDALDRIGGALLVVVAGGSFGGLLAALGRAAALVRWAGGGTRARDVAAAAPVVISISAIELAVVLTIGGGAFVTWMTLLEGRVAGPAAQAAVGALLGAPCLVLALATVAAARAALLFAGRGAPPGLAFVEGVGAAARHARAIVPLGAVLGGAAALAVLTGAALARALPTLAPLVVALGVSAQALVALVGDAALATLLGEELAAVDALDGAVDGDVAER